MKCPYCKAELGGDPTEHGEFLENNFECDTYWDEYRCECPKCGEEFRWIKEYEFVKEFVE